MFNLQLIYLWEEKRVRNLRLFKCDWVQVYTMRGWAGYCCVVLQDILTATNMNRCYNPAMLNCVHAYLLNS